LAESLQVTTVEHVAWIVKVVDVGIVIPLLASVERSGDTPLRRGNGKIRGQDRIIPVHLYAYWSQILEKPCRFPLRP
jgi:hypothetical protein